MPGVGAPGGEVAGIDYAVEVAGCGESRACLAEQLLPDNTVACRERASRVKLARLPFESTAKQVERCKCTAECALIEIVEGVADLRDEAVDDFRGPSDSFLGRISCKRLSQQSDFICHAADVVANRLKVVAGW